MLVILASCHELRNGSWVHPGIAAGAVLPGLMMLLLLLLLERRSASLGMLLPLLPGRGWLLLLLLLQLMLLLHEHLLLHLHLLLLHLLLLLLLGCSVPRMRHLVLLSIATVALIDNILFGSRISTVLIDGSSNARILLLAG